MERNKQDIEIVLQRISNILLMYGGFLSNPGLYSGEMGLVLFFTRYTRYTQNEIYMDYAYGLMEKIQNNINQDTPINYKDGLAGIGSSIEYLVQNDFFKADTDEILEDFDKLIFLPDLPYLQVDKVMDIGYYAAWRISGNSSKKDMIRQFILPHIEKILKNHSIDPTRLLSRPKTIPVGLRETIFRQSLEQISKKDYMEKAKGLHNGLAGWGMSLLTEIDGNDSWISLLTDNFNTQLR